MSILKLVPQPRFRAITPERVKHYQPSILLWGGAIGAGVALFAQAIPIFQKDILKKVPLVAAYYEDNTPESDKPF
ncbi:hypothetical protein QFC21_000074 [Naganishia friedmannii]|uniref:Uncharacterized protein n=1 Tax=Naganishia friedmannii TaxID=89922 RepID=A0ACC2WBZ5_9TREE|nr:hypothetical protein QFC21_000074 [Naganishia friedmannii]